MAETRIIPIGQIAVNTGQIPGVKKNPRLIKGDKYYRLVQSIKDDPEMLDLRELLVYEHNGKFVIIGGNMRYRACKELGYTELPCKIIPPATTPAQLNAYIIKDNAGFGEWDWDMLANDWDASKLEDWGVDVWQEEENTEQTAKPQKDLSDSIGTEYKIEVVCVNEGEQEELYNKLTNEGYECRILTL